MKTTIWSTRTRVDFLGDWTKWIIGKELKIDLLDAAGSADCNEGNTEMVVRPVLLSPIILFIVILGFSFAIIVWIWPKG